MPAGSKAGDAPRPRCRALTRHGQRRLAPSRRWQTRHSPRRPPRRRREPAASRIRSLPSVLPGLRVPLTARRSASTRISRCRAPSTSTTRRHAAEPRDGEVWSRRHVTLDSRCRAEARHPPSSRTRPSMQCTSGRHAAEHVGEHRDLVIRQNVCANAPGRIEGRCEHHDRAVVRRADRRPASASVGQCEPAMQAGPKDGHAPRPRCRALTRHGQLRLHRRADGRRDTRHGVRHVAGANQRRRASGLSPRSCRAFACPSPQGGLRARESLDVGRRPHRQLVGTQPSRAMARFGRAVT
jgi:hypothetical protein